MFQKRIFFFCSALVIFGRLFAQPTITQNHLPKSGDTLRYSNGNLQGFNAQLQKKGANQTWDYSSLSATSQGLYSYLSANRTPYAFYFFNQIGLKTADSFGAGPIMLKNIYTFYTKNNTVFKAEGIGYSYQSLPLASNYSDDDEIYTLPINYNDSVVSTFRFLFSIPLINTFGYLQKGKRTNIADGWGTVITPYKTYTNCLRVRTILQQTDSLITQLGKFPIPRNQVIIRYLSTEERMPVLEIIGSLTNNIFTPTQVLYRDKFLGIQNPFTPRAGFSINKTTGFVNADTFVLNDRTTPFASSFGWQITPPGSAVFVNNTNSGSRNASLVFRNKGKYTVSHTASNIAGSSDTTAFELIDIQFGLNLKENSSTSILLHPNPSQGILHFSKTVKNVVVYSLEGKQLMMQSELCNSLNINELKAGMYTIEFELENKKYYQKVLKL